jgi:hypothetical protein
MFIRSLRASALLSSTAQLKVDSAREALAVDVVSRAMYQEFTRFLELPGRTTFLAARRAWLRLKLTRLSPAELQSVAELLAAGEFAAVIERVHGWQARAAFSPRAHYLAAEAHTALGDVDAAEVERWAFSACLQGILSSGDGTRHKPYVITQLPDEYDVLKLLGLKCVTQQLVQRGRRACDVLSCQDGSQVWFNVSDLVMVPAALQTGPAVLVEQAKPRNGSASTQVTRKKRRASDPLRTVPR